MKLNRTLNGLVTGWLVGSMGLGTYSPRLWAATYYVSPTGNNSSASPTSAGTPWKTLTHAMNQAQAGDMLVLAPGKYDAANGETFPIALKSAVTVQGNSADTSIVSNGTVFSVSGDLSDTWLSGLSLEGHPDAPLVDVTSSDGDSIDLTLSEIAVSGGNAAVVRVNHSGSGDLDLHPTFENNTVTDRNLLSYSENVSGDLVFRPVFQGNTLSGNASGLDAYINVSSGWVALEPTFVENTIVGGGRGLTMDLAGGGTHTPTQGIGLNLVFSGNTLSGDGDGLVVSASSMSGLALSTQAQIQDNQMTEARGTLAELRYQYLHDVALTRNATVSGNNLTGESASPSGSLLDLQENDLSLVQLTSDIELNNNVLTHREYGLDYSVDQIDSCRYVSSTNFHDNTLNHVINGGVNAWMDSVSDSAVDRSIQAHRNSFTDVGDPVEIGINSVRDATWVESIDVSHNTITDSTYLGIGLYQQYLDRINLNQDITLSDNTITGLDGQGIYQSIYSLSSAYAHQNIAMIGNTISNTSDSGIMNYIESISSSRLEQELTISDNTLTNIGDAAIILSLSSMSYASAKLDHSIQNNTINGTDWSAIYAWHYSFSSSQVEINELISQNTISNVNGGSGIQLSFSSISSNSRPMNFEMHDNVISGVDYSGIYVNAYDIDEQSAPVSFTATGNTITDAGSSGIELSFYSPSTVTAPLTASFQGNTISRTERGIHLGLSGASDIVGPVTLEALNNRISATVVGITAQVTPFENAHLELYTNLSGNTVTESEGTAIQALFPNASSIMQSQWVDIDGNVVEGFGDMGIYLSHGGPDSVAQGRVSVSDNLITAGDGTGLQMQLGNATRPLVKASGNTITGNVEGVRVVGTDVGGAPDFGGGALSSPGLNHIADNRSVASDGTQGPLKNFINQSDADLSALNNYWGSTLAPVIDASIDDNEEGNGTVHFETFLTSAPTRAATAELMATLEDDVAPFGPSAHDTVRYTLMLNSTGTVGCAAAEVHVTLGDGSMLVPGSAYTSQGAARLDERHAAFWLGNLEAGGAGAGITFDASLTGFECVPATVQVEAICASQGNVTVTPVATESVANPVSIPVHSTWYVDSDGDGFGTDAVVTCDGAPLGTAALSGDCNDANAAIHPAASELSDDGVDSDCDGKEVCFVDGDGDGYRPDETTQLSTSVTCEATTDGKSTDAVGDCDDTDADVHAAQVFYIDADEDGVGEAPESLCAATLPEGYATEGGDNCPADANANQADSDEDGWGDACDISWQDADDDADGVINGEDNCPSVKNANQDDLDEDGFGDACDDDFGTEDTDGDGLLNYEDNCATVENADQADQDADGTGDACDLDADGDDVRAGEDCDDLDAELGAWAWAYSDADADSVGDSSDPVMVCGSTLPEGYVSTKGDNCPDVANADQADADADGLGDACDVAETPDGVVVGGGGCSVNPGGSPENGLLNLLALAAMLLPALRRRRLNG